MLQVVFIQTIKDISLKNFGQNVFPDTGYVNSKTSVHLINAKKITYSDTSKCRQICITRALLISSTVDSSILQILWKEKKINSHRVIRKVGMLEGTWRAAKTRCDGHSASNLACGQPPRPSRLVRGKACPPPSWWGSWGHDPSAGAQRHATAKSRTPATLTIRLRGAELSLWIDVIQDHLRISFKYL